MGLAQDLLQQADHLATYEGANPSQASLRRAVSTAYYALFHLLIEEAGLRWQGSSEACNGLGRGFQHGPMKNISMQFRKPVWPDWHGKLQPIPQALRELRTRLSICRRNGTQPTTTTTSNGAQRRYKRP